MDSVNDGNTMPTILYLIRHGETDWNATGRWQGHAGVPLNSKGLEQSERLAQRLREAGVQFDAIYSSDLPRAYQTAWEIGAALKVAVQLLPALREIDMGSWSGLTREQIRRMYPREYHLLEQGEDIPRGYAETRALMYKRVTETIDAIVSQHPDEVLALVTHGGPIHALLDYAYSKSNSSPLPREHMSNTSVTILHCFPEGWEIVTYNDVQHLRTLSEELHMVTAPPDDAEQPQE